MTGLSSELKMGGKLGAKLIKGQKAPLSWKLKNAFRGDYILGKIGRSLAFGLTRLTGQPVLTSELSAILRRADGSTVNYGVISRRVVTTAFVTFMIDNMVAETTEWGDFKFHDSGVGTTAAVVADTDIETTDAEARVTGTQVDADPIYRSVGTITYTSSLAITEHGLFSIVTGGTMLDRHVFGAINVVNTDSIQFTYEFTVTEGG